MDAAVEAALGGTPCGVQVSWVSTTPPVSEPGDAPPSPPWVSTTPTVSEPGDAPPSPPVTRGCGEAGAVGCSVDAAS
eukprot:1066166-Amphidinium_carterae.1